MSMIILEVNEVQRTIKASGAGAFVVHDKEVDIVRFSLMSGFADIALDEHSALRVMYQRPGESQVRAQTLTYYDTDGLRSYYDWNLLPSDLAEKGTLTVALCILRIDSEVEEWHTTPCQIRVLDTIHTDDSDEGDETITPTVAQRVAVLETMIQRVASGAPIVVASTSDMTDTDQIYVLTTDGAWYYYDGSAWVAGGVYGAGATSATDTTLTQAGIPADAKAVGDRLVKFNSAKNGLVPASGVKSDKKYYLAGNGKFEKIPFDSVACQNLITILQSCVYDKDVSVNITNLAEALGINSGGDGDDMTFQFGQSITKGSTSRQLTGLESFQMTEIRLVVALHSDFQQGAFCVVSVPAAGNPYLGIGSTGDFYYSNQGTYPGKFSATPANLVDFVGNEPKEVKIQYLNPSGFESRKYISGLKFFFNNYNPSCGFTLFRISGYDGATKLFNLESTGTNGELYDTMTGTTYTFNNTSGMEIVEVEEEE